MSDPKPNPNNPNWWVEPFQVFIRMSVWIVFPVLLASWLGKYLDRQYNSQPKWLLICVGLSFIISITGLIKETLKEYKKIK
jgi:F0F1-type ATP synthase assembly protein I